MKLRLRSCTHAIVLVAAVVAGFAPPARADEPPTRATCVAAYEQGQRLRRSKKLVEAREKFMLCARSPCPAVFQPECARWYAEVEAEMATVVVTIDDPSGPVEGARAYIDDVPLGETVDGIARPVDPGEHELRVTWGDNEVTRRITVVEGTKAQRFVVAPERAAPTPAPVVVPEKPVAPVTTEKKVPFTSYALGGVALAGAGVFSYFWFTGVADGRELARTCAPYCTDAEVDPARTKILVAQISLGAAIAAAAGAVLVYVLTPAKPVPRDALTPPNVFRF